MGQKTKIAGIQFAGTADIERNIRRAGEMLDLAARNGARLAILPEMWAYPWFINSVDAAAKELARPLAASPAAALTAKAKEHKMFIVAPFYEQDETDGALYNSAALLRDDGEIAGVYRKIHVPQIPGWEERAYFQAGNQGFTVFETPFGKLGIQMGWDLLFPEGMRALALGGAEIIAAPMAITAANDDLWRQVALAGAFVNGIWICRVNRIGQENHIEFAGGSLCATPTGDLYDEPAGDAEGVTLWEIDDRVVPLVRRDWPLLSDRRPDQYLALVQSPVTAKPPASTGKAKATAKAKAKGKKRETSQ